MGREMSYIKDNPMKYLSVKLPVWGAFILGVIPVILQHGIDTQIIPPQYHAMLLTVILPALALFGKKKYQPELHPEPTILGFAPLPGGGEGEPDTGPDIPRFSGILRHSGAVNSENKRPGGGAPEPPRLPDRREISCG